MLDWPGTIAILCAGLALAALANWQSRLPFDRRLLKVVPWNGLQFLGVIIVVIMLAHVATLATGRHFGRAY